MTTITFTEEVRYSVSFRIKHHYRSQDNYADSYYDNDDEDATYCYGNTLAELEKDILKLQLKYMHTSCEVVEGHEGESTVEFKSAKITRVDTHGTKWTSFVNITHPSQYDEYKIVMAKIDAKYLHGNKNCRTNGAHYQKQITEYMDNPFFKREYDKLETAYLKEVETRKEKAKAERLTRFNTLKEEFGE